MVSAGVAQARQLGMWCWNHMRSGTALPLALRPRGLPLRTRYFSSMIARLPNIHCSERRRLQNQAGLLLDLSATKTPRLTTGFGLRPRSSCPPRHWNRLFLPVVSWPYCARVAAGMADADKARTWRRPCGTGLRPGPRELLAPHDVADDMVFVLRAHFDSAIAASGDP